MTFDERIDTIATPAQAFPYLADFKNVPAWDPMIPRVEQLTPGSVGLGTRFAVTLSLFGVSTQLEYHVESHDADRRAVMMGSGAMASVIDTIVVTPRRGGSRVQWKAQIRAWGPLQLLDPVATWLLRPGIQQAMRNLKRELDRLAGH